jgi:FkbM family methyltransferase
VKDNRVTAAIRRGLNPAGLDIVNHPRWNTVPWALGHLIRQLGVNCVLDVGGHGGDYGRMLREIGDRGHSVSFEPMPESFAALEACSAGDPLGTVHPFALGAADGALPFHVTSGSVFASFPEPDPEGGRTFRDHLEVVRTEEVPVRRLDGVLDDCIRHVPDPVLFRKSETQGYDFQVLAGAGSRPAGIPGLQVELALQSLYRGVARFPEALATLERLGFDLYCLGPVVHDDSFRVIEYDRVMRRPAGPAPGASSPECEVRA